MILDLTQLRQDYKSTYKSNWPLAEKIKILIEVTKIEQRFQSQTHQAAKRIAISTVKRNVETMFFDSFSYDTENNRGHLLIGFLDIL